MSLAFFNTTFCYRKVMLGNSLDMCDITFAQQSFEKLFYG